MITIKTLSIICLLLFSFILSKDVSGLGVGVSYDDQYNELKLREQKKSELQSQINSLKTQERTLANQIAYLTTRINLTLLQQGETRAEIDKTQELLVEVLGSIDSLSEKLGNLDSSIKDLYDVLAQRIRTAYQMERVGVGVVLDTKNSRAIVLQTMYLRTLQQEDKRLLGKMNDTRGVYQEQKTQLEQLKDEKETLKDQLTQQNTLLEQQKTELSSQQNSKTWLLQTTKSQENNYQKLLAEVEEEIRSIKSALTSLGTKIGEVKKGDVIGHLGNTGCSTGAHLHFGFYSQGVAIDPKSSIDNGTLAWPVKDPLVTQWFNDPDTRDWYINTFGINGHNGIDMTDATLGYGAPVLASADGVAYKVSDSQKCWLTGTVGQGVRIDHPDGTKTIYWHLQ